MITCPTCGHPVPEGQRFCSNCGTDVQAASSYRAPQSASPAASAAPASAPTGSYGYEPGTYDYAPAADNRPSTMTIALIVAAVAILCFCCGLTIGAIGGYFAGPPPAPPAPTPTSLLFLFLV